MPLLVELDVMNGVLGKLFVVDRKDDVWVQTRRLWCCITKVDDTPLLDDPPRRGP